MEGELTERIELPCRGDQLAHLLVHQCGLSFANTRGMYLIN
jgi:hypothetical protein